MTEMLDQIDIIERIMCYFSQDSLESCKKIIEDVHTNIRKALQDETKKRNLSTSKIFLSELTFIKTLLCVYKKLCAKNSKNKPVNLIFKSIFETVKDLLINEKSDFFENEQKQELCSVIYSILQINFFESNIENFYEIGKFYVHNLKFINQFKISHNNEIEKLKFSLKILSVIYESLEIIVEEQCRQESSKKFFDIINELKIKNKIDENKIFSKLLLYECDEIAVQTLLLLVPQFIKSFKSDIIICNIWEEITNLMKLQNGLVPNSRMLLIVCYLFDLCIYANEPSRNKVLPNLFCDKNYWQLIHLGLCGDITMRKQSMYLLKKTTDVLENFDGHITCLDKNESDNLEYTRRLWWDDDLKKDFFNIYKDVVVILEFLDEQQVHIIKPIFSMIEDIVKKITTPLISEKFVTFTWIILIYKRALLHESTQVLKWGLFSLLKVPEYFFSDITVIKQIAPLLVTTLNNTSLYYQDGLTVSQELITFFEKMTKLKTCAVFFSYLIQEICILTWSPEALFFVTHALAQTSKQPSWQYKEIMEIKTFIPKACRTHKKIVRCGIEIELLNSVIAFIDDKNLSLKNFLLLLSGFTEIEIVVRENKMWSKIINWLRNNYSKEDAINCLEENMSLEVQKDFNEKYCVLMLNLFSDAFENNSKIIENSVTNCFVRNKVSKILSSFQGIDKRMYCDVSLLNKFLTVIYQLLYFDLIVEKPKQSSLLKTLSFYIEDVLSFIFMQIKQFSNLYDYYSTQIYKKTFENILKCETLFDVNNKYTILNKLSSHISHDIVNYKNPTNTVTFIQIFCWMEILKITFELIPFEERLRKFSFLKSYLLSSVNESLERNDDSIEKNRDLQVLWGKMNSEFLACKWEILKYFIQNEKFSSENEVSEEKTRVNILLKLCLEALTIGGFGVLSPVISVFQCILPKCNESDIKNSINSMWKLILERKKNDDYKILIKKFVEMLYQKSIIMDETKEGILLEYVDLIFEESSITVVNIFMQHIQILGLENNICPLLASILAKSLIYGPMLEKGERLLLQVCKDIKSLKICEFTDFYTSNEVRGRSVEMLLGLKKDCPSHQIFAQQVVNNLFEEESNFNKGKIRYFTDSYVHRIKHRVMQGLLLLEPIINSKKFIEEKLLKWLYDSLLADNPQTSVKYQLEWILVKILMKDSLLLNNFWLNFDLVEVKTKAMCSLISILYHLSKVIPIDLLSCWINRAIPTLLPLCMDQHFELRLYAQVILLKLFELVEHKNLLDLVKKYEMIHRSITKNIEKSWQRNAGKNCNKLQEDFYYNVFDPIRHYSLQTLYLDFPRLTNVGSDEWIPIEVFLKCGVKSSNNYHISLENENQLLAEIKCATWNTENASFKSIDRTIENYPDLLNENYQKKIIPTKLLASEWDESCSSMKITRSQALKKDGLIVVASLIDRIPNLGGLARTCEIFGAFEFIVGSLKFIEDKQFKGLSVTAEKWITIKEVKVQHLLNYLIEMKQIGYTIIGAEQTLRSQPLNLVKFPKKSLILLGNEKEGIPPNLLPWLDICVEIPQVGVVRSLNVHVSGALFIWEYAKQNYLL